MKIIITNILIFILVTGNLYADSAGLKIGLYDYTNEATRDFYKFGVTAQVDYSFYTSQFAQLNILSGIYYSHVSYRSTSHNNYMYPLQISFITNLHEQNRFITPYCGAGIGGYYTINDAPGYDKSFKTFTYGYHFIFGLLFKIGRKMNLTYELKQNNIMAHYHEEIVSSGINMLLGIQYMF